MQDSHDTGSPPAAIVELEGELLGGRLQIVKRLGRGAFGPTFAARDTEIGRLVLAKLVAAEGEYDHRARLMRGYTELRKLDHPNIARVLDIQESEGFVIVLTEFIDGCSLAEIPTRTIGEYHSLRIFLEIARAMRQAHETGLAHRDIKPTNVLVERITGRAYLTDFGTAKRLDEEDDDPITKEWTFIGTPQFSAPEVIRGLRWEGQDPGVAADIYSYGAMLYSFLSGKAPFQGNDPLSILHQVMEGSRDLAKNDASISKHVPGEVRALIDSAMSIEAGERPASMAEIAEKLEQATRSLPATTWDSSWIAPGAPVMDVALTTIVDTIPRLPEIVSRPTDAVAAPAAARGFESVERSLEHHVGNLQAEYDDARKELRTAHVLWTVCVSTGFAVIVLGVVLLLAGQTAAGAISAASSAIVYFIQKTIAKHERDLKSDATAKRKHVEAGAHWLRIMQAIEVIEDAAHREERKAKLIDVLIDQLGELPVRP